MKVSYPTWAGLLLALMLLIPATALGEAELPSFAEIEAIIRGYDELQNLLQEAESKIGLAEQERYKESIERTVIAAIRTPDIQVEDWLMEREQINPEQFEEVKGKSIALYKGISQEDRRWIQQLEVPITLTLPEFIKVDDIINTMEVVYSELRNGIEGVKRRLIHLESVMCVEGAACGLEVIYTRIEGLERNMERLLRTEGEAGLKRNLNQLMTLTLIATAISIITLSWLIFVG